MTLKHLAPVLAALAVTSCGVIPTPAVSLPDVTLDLPPSAVAQGRVIYVRQDAFEASIPSALGQVNLTGTATYRANGGTLRQVGVYVRPSLDTLPGTCISLAATVFACEAAGEAAQAVGTLTLSPGASNGFTLSGPALDTAARAGEGYFGVRAVEGDSLLGEQVRLTGLQARAKF